MKVSFGRVAALTSFAVAGFGLSALSLLLYWLFFVNGAGSAWMLPLFSLASGLLAIVAGLAVRALWRGAPNAPRLVRYTGLSACLMSLTFAGVAVQLDTDVVPAVSVVGSILVLECCFWYAGRLEHGSKETP